MAEFLSRLSNASSNIDKAKSLITLLGGNSSYYAGNTHMHGTDGSVTFGRPGLKGEAQKINLDISNLEISQIPLVEERQDLIDRYINSDSQVERDQIVEDFNLVNSTIADIDAQIEAEKINLEGEFQNVYDNRILSLENNFESLPPFESELRETILKEIEIRESLFNSGITEPYMQDVLVDMSRNDSKGIRNSVDRIIDGDVNMYTFTELEVPLGEALTFDRNFDPTTQVALFVPPDDRILVTSQNAGGFFVGNGNILMRDDQGTVVMVHEVNHALNVDNNEIFLEGQLGDSRRAITSFTTEIRAYDVDNRYFNNMEATVAALAASTTIADYKKIMLGELGYDPENLSGNQIHLADQIDRIIEDLPENLDNISTDQQRQIESLFISDLILVRSDLYEEAADQYENNEEVREILNEIITEGPGGNFDNSDPNPPELAPEPESETETPISWWERLFGGG